MKHFRSPIIYTTIFNYTLRCIVNGDPRILVYNILYIFTVGQESVKTRITFPHAV